MFLALPLYALVMSARGHSTKSLRDSPLRGGRDWEDGDRGQNILALAPKTRTPLLQVERRRVRSECYVSIAENDEPRGNRRS